MVARSLLRIVSWLASHTQTGSGSTIPDLTCGRSANEIGQVVVCSFTHRFPGAKGGTPLDVVRAIEKLEEEGLGSLMRRMKGIEPGDLYHVCNVVIAQWIGELALSKWADYKVRDRWPLVDRDGLNNLPHALMGFTGSQRDRSPKCLLVRFWLRDRQSGALLPDPQAHFVYFAWIWAR